MFILLVEFYFSSFRVVDKLGEYIIVGVLTGVLVDIGKEKGV